MKLCATLLTALMATSLHAEEMQMRTLVVTCTVPSSGWSLEVDEVRRVGDELWFLSSLTRPEGLALTVISEVSAMADVYAPDLPIKHFMIGKTWNWKNEEPITFIKNRKEVAEEMDAGKLVYKKADPPTPPTAEESE